MSARPRFTSRARYAVTILIAVAGGAAALAPAASAAPATPAPHTAVPLSMVAAAPVTSVSPYAVARTTHATDVWRQGVTGKGVDVALVDTGIAHVAGLAGRGQVLAGPDAVTGGAGGGDVYGHGTVVAGLIGAHDPAHAIGDPKGAHGLAPDAGLVNVRLAGRDGRMTDKDLVAAVRWVTAHAHDRGVNVRVLNLSLGLPAADRTGAAALLQATTAAWKAGIVVVSAGGNDGPRAALDAPASAPTGIAVGAAGADGAPASFTSLGTTTRRIDVLAPGVGILGLRAPGSTLLRQHPGAGIGTSWLRGSGSSQAAAIVSGAAALLLSAHPELTPDHVRALLAATAHSARRGAPGVIDVAAALRAAASVRATSTTDRNQSHTVSHASSSSTRPTPWTGVSWRGVSWRGVSWRGVSWRGVSWRGVSWRGVSWRGVSWRGVSWRGVSWR